MPTTAQLDIMRRTAVAARDYCRLLGLGSAHVRGLTIITVRQVIQESGAGTSDNARRNNFFGQKSRIRDGAEINVDQWATGEYLLTSNPEWRDGHEVVDPDWMYTYACLEDSVRAHIDYITGRSGMARYLNPPADPDALATWLVTPPRGYATDPTYAQSLRTLDARWGVTPLADQLLQEPAMPLPNATQLGHAADLLTQWGHKVTRVAGWEARQASTIPLVPVAIIQHHTAARDTPTSFLLGGDSARSLPGPLCQWQVKRSGEIILLAAGYANHAGFVDPSAFDVIAAGHAPLDAEVVPGPDSTTWSANRHSIGIEADGPGGPDDWSAEELAACIALNAALSVAYGWTAAVRTGAHKELTRRKPGDPVVHMGRFRRDILAEIARRTGAPAQASPLSTVKREPRPWNLNDPSCVKVVQALVGASVDGIYGRQTKAATAARRLKLGLPPGDWYGADTLRQDLLRLGWFSKSRLDVGAHVKAIQWLAGDDTPDGIYGPTTEQWVDEMRAWAGIPAADGVGADTIRAIVR